MNKRGQFFLIAAVIIIGLLLGFATIANKAQRKGIDKTKIYNLYFDTNVDEADMINYGGAGYSEEEVKIILDALVEIYSDIDNIYFIIGKNSGGIQESYYRYDSVVGISVLEEGEKKQEIISYDIGSLTQEFYAMIIEEKNQEQFVIQMFR